MTSKVITFALWGDNPTYTQGAIRNVQLGQELFPEWKCRFYVNNIPQNIFKALSDIADVIEMPAGDYRDYGRRAGGKQPENSMFWRLYPYFDKDVDVFISRDTDSRLSKREKIAVDEFLVSDKQFHIMRDHPGHCTGTPILMGMWGMKTSIELDLQMLLDDYKQSVEWPMIDQWFLMKSIYPLVKDYSMIHHDESCAKGCQMTKSNPKYWDAIYWEDGPNSEHRMFAPRNSFTDKFSNCIGIDYDANDVVSSQSLAWLNKWIDTGVYWWKK